MFEFVFYESLKTELSSYYQMFDSNSMLLLLNSLIFISNIAIYKCDKIYFN